MKKTNILLNNRPPLNRVIFHMLYLNISIYILFLTFKYLIKSIFYFYKTGYWYWDNYFFKDTLAATLSFTIPISIIYFLIYFYGDDKNWEYKEEYKDYKKRRENKLSSLLRKEINKNNIEKD